MVQTEATKAVEEWCEQAQKIVAYPEDFGLRRSQVAGLASELAEQRQKTLATEAGSNPTPARVLALASA